MGKAEAYIARPTPIHSEMYKEYGKVFPWEVVGPPHQTVHQRFRSERDAKRQARIWNNKRALRVAEDEKK